LSGVVCALDRQQQGRIDRTVAVVDRGALSVLEVVINLRGVRRSTMRA